MAVGRVTIHHEGAGAPANASQIARIAHGGYTYGIGTHGFTRFRSVSSSFATYRYNHVSLDICLSGNRMDYPVTDADINAIHGAFMDCYNRGEVTGNPLVVAHRNSPGSSTVCPGTKAMDVWSRIAGACHAGSAPPKPSPTPPPSGGAPPFPGTNLRNYIEGHGTRQWQQQMRNRGWSIGVDDKYGGQSEGVCRQFQAEKHLTVDGIVGPQTWNATWTAPIT